MWAVVNAVCLLQAAGFLSRVRTGNRAVNHVLACAIVALALPASVAVVALVLPYSPLAGLLGFAALPPVYLLAIAAIVAAYVVSAELVKPWFYRHYGT